MFCAHSTPSPGKDDWQTLRSHLLQVGEQSAERGAKFGAGAMAAIAGLLHDLGKYSLAFQRRLEGGPPVDHATAGARVALDLAREARAARRLGDAFALELVAYAVAGHHGGLPDRYGGQGSSLSERTNPQNRTVPDLLDTWRDEIDVRPEALMPNMALIRGGAGPVGIGFQLAMLGRMVFSCLIDADRRDTELFYVATGGVKANRSWPALPDIVGHLATRFDDHMARLRAQAKDGPVQTLRNDVLAHARRRARDAPGVFTLSVPTGGGKTLASLAFALDHARAHGLHRIVAAIPFTSIVEQTAAIYADVLGEEIVLEHHSAIQATNPEQEDSLATEGGVNDGKLRLAMEDWAAPVVVTTNVQLLESLFSHRPSRCRKLHNLSKSVIILDEAQAIPRHVLRPSVAALDELARNYGCTIVLCTATQPALRTTDGFAGGFDVGPERELAPDPDHLAHALRRVTLRRAGRLDDEAVVDELRASPQGLVIVNTRGHALTLYRAAQAAGLEGVVHLTTRQCAKHRRAVLADVRERLKQGQSCRLIATSLVEAGVDLDFPLLWRAEAGLEQIHQAAGRCNREGRRSASESIVTVFTPAEAAPPRDVAVLASCMARVAARHEDLLSLPALTDYFREVYWQMQDRLDALPIEGPRSALAAFSADASGTSFDYRRIGEAFRLIESGLEPVIVPYDGEARAALARLGAPQPDIISIARALQPYIVQIPPRARALMIAKKQAHILYEHRFGDQFVALAVDNLYGIDTGLLWDDDEFMSMETLIF